MIIKIGTEEKRQLLKAVAAGYLETSKIPAFQKILDEQRPDLKIKNMTDEELDARIRELEAKFHS